MDNKEKWFVIATMPYEGIYMDEFDTEREARNKWNLIMLTYNNGKPKTGLERNYEDVPYMIIKGEIIETFEENKL